MIKFEYWTVERDKLILDLLSELNNKVNFGNAISWINNNNVSKTGVAHMSFISMAQKMSRHESGYLDLPQKCSTYWAYQLAYSLNNGI